MEYCTALPHAFYESSLFLQKQPDSQGLMLSSLQHAGLSHQEDGSHNASTCDPGS